MQYTRTASSSFRALRSIVPLFGPTYLDQTSQIRQTIQCPVFSCLAQALNTFLKAKADLDAAADPSMNDVMDALHRLTTVR